MKKAVIFDMDGLMFDTESAYSVVQEKMSAKRGKEFTNEVKITLMGERAVEVMRRLGKFWGTNENVKDLLKEQDEMLVKLYKNSVGKLEGLDQLLLFLNEHNIRKCIGTSSRMFLVEILLEKFGLKEEFEFVVSGDSVEKGKPDPEIYLRCLSSLDLEGLDCLVLEDSLNGVRSAISAQCSVCAVPSDFTKHEDFSIADVVATSLGDKKIQEFLLK